MSERPTKATCERIVLKDELQGWLPPKPANVTSVEPEDPCEPVRLERARRKEVDAAIFERLRQIQTLTTRVAIGVGAMLGFAALEYLGVVGNGNPPIWARAVLNGLRWIVRQ